MKCCLFLKTEHARNSAFFLKLKNSGNIFPKATVYLTRKRKDKFLPKSQLTLGCYTVTLVFQIRKQSCNDTLMRTQYYKVISSVKTRNQNTWILVQSTIPNRTQLIGHMSICGGKVRKQEAVWKILAYINLCSKTGSRS